MPEKEGGIDVFLKGLEFGKTIMENAGDSSEMDVMKEAVKTLGPAFMQVLSTSPSAAPTPAVRPYPARIAAPPPPLQEKVDANMQMIIKAYETHSNKKSHI